MGPDLSARGGFTFIEVLVTLTLLAIASGVLVSAHSALLKADGSSNVRLKAGFEIQSIQSDLLNGSAPTNRPAEGGQWGVSVEPQEPADDARTLLAISLTPPGKEESLSTVILGSRQESSTP